MLNTQKKYRKGAKRQRFFRPTCEMLRLKAQIKNKINLNSLERLDLE